MRHGMNPGGERGPDSVAWQYREGLPVGDETNFSVSPIGTQGSTRLRLLRSGQAGANVSSISSDTLAGPGRRVLAYYESLQLGRKGSGGIYGVSINTLSRNRLRTIRFTGRNKLYSFTLWGQPEVRSVDLSGSPELVAANFNTNAFLSQVNLSRCGKLSQLYLIACTRLRTFSISEASRSKITFLVIGSCPLLENRLNLRGMFSLSDFQAYNVYLGETADFTDTQVAYFDGSLASFRHYILTENFYGITVAQNTHVRTIDATAAGFSTYIDATGSSLESLLIPPDYVGSNGKATINVGSTQMGEAALVAMLNNLGDATNNFKTYIDISNCPGTATAAVTAAANSAVSRGWNVYGIA